jgi:two-component system response regulator MprA
MRILVVEDDVRMTRLLRRGLEDEGCSVIVAGDGQQGLELARNHDLDAIILDLMLPKLDGFTVARRLREEKNRTPILMLTARDAIPDIVSGLDLGADDYLTKPFSFKVLVARLRAVVRRGAALQTAQLRVGDLVLDPASHELFRGEQKIPLTRTECKLLEFLLRRAGKVVPRETLIGAVWGLSGEIESNTLDAFIRLLRAKIEDPSRPKLLHTVRGVGYRLREEDQP